jgi:hypothetical protein
MKANWPAGHIVGMDHEVVEDHEPLQGVRVGERVVQDREGPEANLDGPVEWRDEANDTVCRHLTHLTFLSFANW